jgi:hypothetical protein
MSHPREPRVARALLPICLLGLAACDQGLDGPELREQELNGGVVTTNNNTGSKLVPILECVDPREAQTGKFFVAFFGYQNDSGHVLSVPVGSSNKFSPNPADHKQPTLFEKGRQTKAFQVRFDSGNLTWTLMGRSVTASKSSTLCPAEDTKVVGRDPGLRLPGNRAGQAVKDYLNTVSITADKSKVDAATGKLRGIPPNEIIGVLQGAFDVEPDPSLRWALLQAAVAYRHPICAPLFARALAVQLPAGFDERTANPHDPGLRSEASVLARAVAGLKVLAQDGSPDAWALLIQAVRHPLRGVRAMAIFSASQVAVSSSRKSELNHVTLPADRPLLSLRRAASNDLKVSPQAASGSDDPTKSQGTKRK